MKKIYSIEGLPQGAFETMAVNGRPVARQVRGGTGRRDTPAWKALYAKIEALPKSLQAFARERAAAGFDVASRLQAAVQDGVLQERARYTGKAQTPGGSVQDDEIHGHALRLGISDEQARRYLAGEGN